MNDRQTKQTMCDISCLYDTDIGCTEDALQNRLMFERKQKTGAFKNLARKDQLSNLTLNQQWTLYLHLMLDWMHFQTRCIVPHKRTVKIAEPLEQTTCAPIAEITNNLENGIGLKARVSRTMLREVKPAKKLRDDPLLWNWNIHHFHLGDFNSDIGYAEGTDRLLFVYLDEKYAVLLGIGDHNDFSKRWLFDTLFETLPELLDKFRLKGISGPGDMSHIWTDEERKQLWGKFMVPITYQNFVIYPPGHGVATSGHATRIVRNQGDILRTIGKLDQGNPILRSDYAPIKMSFNGSQIELSKDANKLFVSHPLI